MKVKKFKRRIKSVSVSKEFLEEFFLGEELHLKIQNPLPKDAQIIQIGYDIYRNVIVAFVKSEEFPEVEEAGVPEPYYLVVIDLECNKKAGR